MDKIEIKAALAVDDTGAITGTAWPFGSPDTAGDVITKGAFTAPAALPMLWAHDQSQVVGVWDSISETDAGLQVKGRLLVEDVARAREVRAMIQNKAVSGLSIGFRTKAAKPRAGRGRTITAVDLAEVSIVAVPSHQGARITSIKSDGTPTTSPSEKESHAMENENLEPEAVETKDAPALDTKALDALVGRLDKIEARMNRPGSVAAPAVHSKVDDAEIERKAFVEFARKGVERMEQKAVSALTVSSDANFSPRLLGTESQ